MAIGDAYATVGEYRSHIDKDSSEQDTAIAVDLLATSRWLERRLGVETFNKDETTSVRVYIGKGSSVLKLLTDDGRQAGIASTGSLSIKVDDDDDGSFADETALATSDYELRPLNAAVGPEPKPWTSIVLPTWSSRGTWSAGRRIQVTAQHGWPSVPSAIKEACIIFTAMIRGDASEWLSGQVSTLDQVESVSPQARKMLRDLLMVYSPTAGVAFG